MNAQIAYAVRYLPHPYKAEARREGMHAWCLVKKIVPEIGSRTEEVVAIFNLDSEAETFMGHVIACGLDGKLVDVDPDFRELAILRRSRP